MTRESESGISMPAVPPPVAEAPLKWRVEPWRAEPAKRYAVLAAAILAALIGWWLFGSALMALLGMVIVLASTADFWLGVHMRLDENGASVRCGLSVSGIEWSQVKRVIVHEETIKLSPLVESTRMDPFRGVSLRVRGPQREAAMNYIQRHIEDSCSISGIES